MYIYVGRGKDGLPHAKLEDPFEVLDPHNVLIDQF